jgi:hypothetical protein
MNSLSNRFQEKSTWIDSVLEREYPSVEINADTIEQTVDDSNWVRGSVRVSTGMIFTDDEYEIERQRAINRPNRLK